MSKLFVSICWAVIAAIFLLSCKSFKEPEFIDVQNGRVAEIGLNGSTLNFDLHYFNPNKSKLQLKYAEGDAWLDETRLGHFIIDTLIHIPANADFLMPVTLKVDMTYLLRNSIAAFISKEVLIKIEGKAKVGKGGVFIHYPIHYEGKQNLSELLKPRWSQYDSITNQR